MDLDTNGDEKKERGRRSPTLPLEEGVKYLADVENKLGRGPFSLASLVEALGHKSASGPAKAKVGTLTHFKLLERSSPGTYRISQLGMRILRPPSPADLRKALAEAAKAPSLYADLLKEYLNRGLPQLLHNILIHNHEVLPSTASDVAANFRQTMGYAGLLRHGVLYDSPAEEEDKPDGSSGESQADELSPPPEKRSTTGVGPAQHSEVVGLTDYRIPLTKRRSALLRLPLPLDQSDLDRIKGWLDLMSDVLTATESEEDRT